jgi:acid phosphatase family membrane protein YuiD
MDVGSYERTISDEDVTSRLPKIDSVVATELLEVVNALKIRKKAGYQEGLMNELVKDIKEAFNHEDNCFKIAD